jgi:hypothetical protein
MTARIFVMVFTENDRLEQMTMALLQSAGCCPMLPAADEAPTEALRRVRPDAVLLDCEHPAAVSERFFELAGEYGIGILVYGRETREADADLVARQQNVCRLTLPADGNLLAHAVLGAMG